jgi:hypothetical protein
MSDGKTTTVSPRSWSLAMESIRAGRRIETSTGAGTIRSWRDAEGVIWCEFVIGSRVTMALYSRSQNKVKGWMKETWPKLQIPHRWKNGRGAAQPHKTGGPDAT